jgi:hypothetical protein
MKKYLQSGDHLTPRTGRSFSSYPFFSPKVVDLLVAMCRAALESPRKSIIFEPYPSVVDPTDPKTLAFNPKVYLFWKKKLMTRNGKWWEVRLSFQYIQFT